MSLLGTGLTLNDFHGITYGVGLNILYAHINALKRARGEEVADPEKQYRMMKADLPAVTAAYQAGEINKTDYERYVRAIREWESSPDGAVRRAFI